ncbi:DUF4166 domain-containing protein [Streptomyces sp. TP-A0356]|uniref:DUF4166 domain-containing protein n=1 Tax=Streptomyces sp. TP-A0356 TaxID=1359208 RepID=UPI0006E3D1A1
MTASISRPVMGADLERRHSRPRRRLSGEDRFRAGPVDVRVPEVVGPQAEARESSDESTGHFRLRPGRQEARA